MKLNKKGFTLVELLAVIAILGIIIVMLVPNVLQLFNESKENAFITQAQSLYKSAQQQYLSDSVNGTAKKYYCSECTDSSTVGKKLNVEKSNKVKYLIEFKDGKIVYLLVTDGTDSVTVGTTGSSTAINIDSITTKDNTPTTTVTCPNA